MSMRVLPVLSVVSSLCTFSTPVASQAPASPPASAAVPPTGFPGLDRYRASRVAVYSDDAGERARYRANMALPPPAATENRVVFFGDSITDLWRLDQSFPGKPHVNRGIGGQTTSQMLVRFRQDVIELRPRVVVRPRRGRLASDQGGNLPGRARDRASPRRRSTGRGARAARTAVGGTARDRAPRCDGVAARGIERASRANKNPVGVGETYGVRRERNPSRPVGPSTYTAASRRVFRESSGVRTYFRRAAASAGCRARR